MDNQKRDRIRILNQYDALFDDKCDESLDEVTHIIAGLIEVDEDLIRQTVLEKWYEAAQKQNSVIPGTAGIGVLLGFVAVRARHFWIFGDQRANFGQHPPFQIMGKLGSYRELNDEMSTKPYRLSENPKGIKEEL